MAMTSAERARRVRARKRGEDIPNEKPGWKGGPQHWNVKDPSRSYPKYTKHGLSHDDYANMLKAQGGKCACCGGSDVKGRGNWRVDHDHVTGVIRGLLCHCCNVGIGLLGDQLEGVQRAVHYLKACTDGNPVYKGTS